MLSNLFCNMWNSKKYKYLINLHIYINTIKRVIWFISNHIILITFLLIKEIFSPVHSSILNIPTNSHLFMYIIRINHAGLN